MKILLNTVENPTPELKTFSTRVKTYMTGKLNVEIVENRDITKSVEYALVVNVGYDYRIMSETFKLLYKFNPQTKIVFINPAGESWFPEFNALVRKSADYMGVDVECLNNVEDFWSLNNFEKFFDFLHKSAS